MEGLEEEKLAELGFESPFNRVFKSWACEA